jgi:hypothetical protein
MRHDQALGDAKAETPIQPNTTLDPNDAQFDDAESQMRRALGLLGEPPRHRTEPERSESLHRSPERFGGNSGTTHRRRFVQDGDIPVTVLRRESGHDLALQRTPSPTNAPVNNRLQRVEAMLATETAARERAERALAESQSVVRDLQTKIGHAELARTEAVETLRREREATVQLRQDAMQVQEQLREAAAESQAADQARKTAVERLAAEQQARQRAEKTLSQLEAARLEADRERAEAIVVTAPQIEAVEWTPPAPVVAVKRASDTATVSPAIRRRRAAEPTVIEQEPVKWWLNTKPSVKRR